MLQVNFVNDGTAEGDFGNYDYSVSVNGKEISSGRIENFERVNGWQGLIKKFSESLENAPMLENV